VASRREAALGSPAALNTGRGNRRSRVYVSDPNRTFDTGFIVSSVVHVPFGIVPERPTQGLDAARDDAYYFDYHQRQRAAERASSNGSDNYVLWRDRFMRPLLARSVEKKRVEETQTPNGNLLASAVSCNY
jgi:hypothetical protein